ncbi:FAD-dependent oxidoreductase [Thioalkalivibrio sp. ALE16]|uniref:FAD-dependent oxidoreductase n=1 Tax=Thioalkalivibrio sp. ALE16 TaxID=1158172 RepID=UPI000361333F|nr:FAD-dependent oxidoreductase [Thioalkalivibrio sp. ALE16]
MRVVVIGAGVIGVTTAWYLQEAGAEVVLVDAGPAPASGSSQANGGMLHASHAEPWNTPGVGLDLLRFLGRTESPLLLRPRALPGLAGWGLRFLWHSRRSLFEQHTRLNARLAAFSLREIDRLQRELASEGLDFDFRRCGILKLFQDPASQAHNRAASEAMIDEDVRFEDWDVERIIAEEPALAPVRDRLCGGLFFPGDAIGDAARFTEQLLAIGQRRGIRYYPNVTVRRLRTHLGRIDAVETSEGPIAADACVVANGYHAPDLLRPLGLHLPVAPVKGYSLTLPMDADCRLNLPLIDDANKVVMTPLGARLRLAGTAEFAGRDRHLNIERAANVLDQCRRTLTGLPATFDPQTMAPWTGLRPMSARGTPILGPTAITGLHLNTGSGHLGWTFACGAAALVRAGVLGETPSLPMEGLGL